MKIFLKFGAFIVPLLLLISCGGGGGSGGEALPSDPEPTPPSVQLEPILLPVPSDIPLLCKMY